MADDFNGNDMMVSRIHWLLLLCLLSSSCNQVIDTQTAGITETIPASAIQAVVSVFPQAEAIAFTPVESNRIWQVRFTQQGVAYRGVTSPVTLLTAYRLSATPVPDSLVNPLRNTAINGGVIANLRQRTYTGGTPASPGTQTVLADYDGQAGRSTLRWTITTLAGKITYLVEIVPDAQLEYQTYTLTDLPTPIQQSLAAQQLTFDNARVELDSQAKKRYTLTARQQTATYTLFYDDAGGVRGATNLTTAQRFTAISQLPLAIQSYISGTAELAGFNLGGQFSLLAKTTFGALETYSVNLQKGQQTYFLLFDRQGQLLTRSYLAFA